MAYPKIHCEYDFSMFAEEILCDESKKFDYSVDFMDSLLSTDGSLLPTLLNKVQKVLLNPHQGKHLKSNLKGWKEVRVTKNYRLYFKFDSQKNLVYLQNFSHKKYQKKLMLNT